MSCPREQEALSGSPSGLAHAATCGSCSEALELLTGARARIAEARPEMAPQDRARMWRNIELAEMQPRFGFAGFVPAVLATATAVAIFFLIFRPAAQVDSESWVVSRGDVVRVGRRVAAVTGSATLVKRGVELEMLPSSRLTLDASELELEAGRLDVDLERDCQLAVVTTDVRVFSLGGAFRVAVDDAGTSIAVRDGVVRVGDEDVRAGERRHIARARAEVPAAPAVDEPANALADNLEPDAAPRKTLRREESSSGSGSGSELEERKGGRSKSSDPDSDPNPDPNPQAFRPSDLPVQTPDPEPQQQQPDTSREIDRLAQHADTLRKNGRLEEAITAYTTLAAREDAEDYAEEALYRAAKILAELGKNDDAMKHLAEARKRFPNGPLAPERTALEEALRR